MSENRIDLLKVDNFKSLVGTTIEFSKNSFFIGINGSGKTTILQSIDFLSAIAKGSVNHWLDSRGWRKKELTFFGGTKKLIEYHVEFFVNGKGYRWSFVFNRDLMRCTYEKMYGEKREPLFEVKDGRYLISSDKGIQSKEKISFNYEGSILSALKEEVLGKEVSNIRDFFGNIRSAEPLSPQLMKKRARHASGSIGLGGEKLSAFIDELSDGDKEKLKDTLKLFFPRIQLLTTRALRSGWKDLSIGEKYSGLDLNTNARQLSDGILRIMAILSQLLSAKSVLIFDEIEDGINQEIVDDLVTIIINSPHQTIVTTHSPLLINYLDDDLAEKSIFFVYRKESGETRVINFFEALKAFKQLSPKEYALFGPGELMQQVNLVELSNFLSQE